MSNIGGNANFRGSIRKGAWTGEEDDLLRKCIHKHGEGHWHRVPQRAGLNRCRKSCRLRWFNYLKPNIKRGQFTEEEVDLIIRLHNLLGNKWSLIAGRIPGRTANDVKNYWNTHLQKKLLSPLLSLPPKNPSTPSCPKSNNIIRPQPSVLLPKISPSVINKPDPLSSLICGGPTEISVLCDDHLVVDGGEDDNDGNAKWWENLVEIEKGDNNDNPSSSMQVPCLAVNHVQEVNNVWEEDNHLWNFDVNMWK